MGADGRVLTEAGFVLHAPQGVRTRPLLSLQLGDAVNECFVHRERGPVKVAGCHFPDDIDDRLVESHGNQKKKFGNY